MNPQGIKVPTFHPSMHVQYVWVRLPPPTSLNKRRNDRTAKKLAHLHTSKSPFLCFITYSITHQVWPPWQANSTGSRTSVWLWKCVYARSISERAAGWSVRSSGADGPFGWCPKAPSVLAAKVISLKVMPASRDRGRVSKQKRWRASAFLHHIQLSFVLWECVHHADAP